MRRPLPPELVYPANDSRVTARFVRIPRGGKVRIVEAGPADGPVVVCIAGWASSVFQYRKNLPVLADAGFRAIAVDLPGQGESDRPADPSFYTLDNLATSLLEVLDALQTERVSLVGQSLGGAVAIRLVERAGGRVARLALIAPVGLARVRLVRLGKVLLPLAIGPLLSKISWRVWWAIALRLAYGPRTKPTARDVDEYWAASRDPRFVPSLIACIQRIDWNVLDEERLGALRLPVRVICGSHDPLLPCQEIVERANRLPNWRSIVIQGGGHPVQEELPGEVNPPLVEFLRG